MDNSLADGAEQGQTKTSQISSSEISWRRAIGFWLIDYLKVPVPEEGGFVMDFVSIGTEPTSKEPGKYYCSWDNLPMAISLTLRRNGFSSGWVSVQIHEERGREREEETIRAGIGAVAAHMKEVTARPPETPPKKDSEAVPPSHALFTQSLESAQQELVKIPDVMDAPCAAALEKVLAFMKAPPEKNLERKMANVFEFYWAWRMLIDRRLERREAEGYVRHVNTILGETEKGLVLALRRWFFVRKIQYLYEAKGDQRSWLNIISGGPGNSQKGRLKCLRPVLINRDNTCRCRAIVQML